MSADDHRCEPIYDTDGTVLGHARISPDVSAQGRVVVAALIKAAVRLQEEWDAADPEAAVEQALRQAEGIARIRARVARLRGDAP